MMMCGGIISMIVASLIVQVSSHILSSERSHRSILSFLFGSPPPSTPIAVIVGSYSLKETHVVDLTGGECQLSFPPLPDDVFGLFDSSLHLVGERLVLCNVIKPWPQFYDYYSGFYSQYYENATANQMFHRREKEDLLQYKHDLSVCIGVDKSSSDWSVLPPNLPSMVTHGASVRVGERIVIIGQPMVGIDISEENVDTNEDLLPASDFYGDSGTGCAVYDEEKKRIIYVNYGVIMERSPDLVTPWRFLTDQLAVRTHIGCAVVKIDGQMSLFVAGGRDRDMEPGEMSTLVEYIRMNDMENGRPKVPARMKLRHGWRPSVVQVGSDIFVLGGVESVEEFEEGEGKFVEKWDGHFWNVLSTSLDDYSLQFEPRVEFMERDFCQ